MRMQQYIYIYVYNIYIYIYTYCVDLVVVVNFSFIWEAKRPLHSTLVPTCSPGRQKKKRFAPEAKAFSKKRNNESLCWYCYPP